MFRRFCSLALFALVLAAGSGCAKKSRIEVQSDTCWDGFVDNQARLEACGNQNYEVLGTITCVSLRKQTQNGYLRVRIEGGPWAETTEPNGTASVCR